MYAETIRWKNKEYKKTEVGFENDVSILSTTEIITKIVINKR